MITEKSVQEILEAAKIEEVVQDFVSLRRRGSNLIGLCPFHSEKTPSFNVSPARNIFKCFGCGRGGNAVQFLMEHEQYTFPEAIRYLAKKYGIEIEETGNTDEAVAQRQHLDSLYLVNDYARDFFQQQLFDSDRGRSVGLNYFRERGFREETIRKFGLGFAPDQPDTFTRQAVAAGYDIDLLRTLGLTSKYDRDFFRNRVIFTIHNLSGKVIGFAGRILAKDVKAPKYINTPETEVYVKSRVLYGANFARRAIRQEDECILVEGYTDVISLHQAGIENVVASSGTSLTEDQIRLIKRHSDNVKFLFDGDLAGTKAALRGLDMVLAQDLNVSVVMLPEGEDPDSYLRKAGAAAFREFITRESKDFIFFKAGLLLKDAAGDPVKKTHAIKDIVGSIARIPDPLKRSLFIKECAALVEVDEQLLVAEVNRLISQQLHQRQQREQRDAPAPAGTGIPGVTSAGAADPAPEGAGPAPSAARAIGDGFQERDIARILIEFGDQLFDPDERITVAEYIVTNIEDVLDYFDSDLYRQVVDEFRQALRNGLALKPAHFTQHQDGKLRALAVDLLSSPFTYSENWEKRWDIRLQTQKKPEDNFVNEALTGLKRLKKRKIGKLIQENQDRLKTPGISEEEVAIVFKVHYKLKEIERKLADDLGTVIW